MTGWVVGATWGDPFFFTYGPGGIYFQNGYVYNDGEQIGTADEYAQQAADLAASGQPVPTFDTAANDNADDAAEDDNWMPLGVFAMQKDKSAASNMLLQLSVSRDGTIAGSYANQDTGGHATVQGAVDKETQRAAWSFGDDRSPVMETGIFNLTKDETAALVHFGDGKTQQWYLVRQEAPSDDSE